MLYHIHLDNWPLITRGCIQSKRKPVARPNAPSTKKRALIIAFHVTFIEYTRTILIGHIPRCPIYVNTTNHDVALLRHSFAYSHSHSPLTLIRGANRTYGIAGPTTKNIHSLRSRSNTRNQLTHSASRVWTLSNCPCSHHRSDSQPASASSVAPNNSISRADHHDHDHFVWQSVFRFKCMCVQSERLCAVCSSVAETATEIVALYTLNTII